MGAMSGGGRYPRWRVLVDGDRVAVDPTGVIASVAGGLGGFPLAPELLLDLDGPRGLDVRELVARPASATPKTSPGGRWVRRPGRRRCWTPSARPSRPTRAENPLPPRRQDWFAEPWRAEVDAWIDETLVRVRRRRTGPSVPVKVWSLSAVLRVPTDVGPVFLKATCDHFRSEPRITDLLGRLLPGRVPALLGHQPDRGWQLMEPLGGVSDEDDPTPRLAAPTATAIAAIQLDCAAHVEQLRAAGCPERGPRELVGSVPRRAGRQP